MDSLTALEIAALRAALSETKAIRSSARDRNAGGIVMVAAHAVESLIAIANLAPRLADALEAAQAEIAAGKTSFLSGYNAGVACGQAECDRLTAALREAKAALETCVRQIDRCQDYHKDKYAAEAAITTINAALEIQP